MQEMFLPGMGTKGPVHGNQDTESLLSSFHTEAWSKS